MPDNFNLHGHGLATETNKSCLFNNADSATNLLLFFRPKISSDILRFANKPFYRCVRRLCRLRFAGLAIDFNRRGCGGVGDKVSFINMLERNPSEFLSGGILIALSSVRI